MAHKQSRSLACPIGKGAQSAHSNGQPNPHSAYPEHFIAGSPADDVGRGALPEWVRRLAAYPKKTVSNPNPETTLGSPEFLTVAELAVALRVSARTLRRRLAAHEIPHIRVGRQVRVPRRIVLAEWQK